MSEPTERLSLGVTAGFANQRLKTPGARFKRTRTEIGVELRLGPDLSFVDEL
jgi:hypothetical protein